MVSSGEADPTGAHLLGKKEWHARFDEQVEVAAQAGLPISLLFVDVNNFKDVNDNLGHHIGDEVIAQIQNVVGQFTGEFLIGGHVGGDEFAISGHIKREEAEAVKENLREVFAQFLETPENEPLKELRIGLAIGVSSRQDKETGSDLKKEADEAMYQDKLQQLPELTIEQLSTLEEARVALAAVGLRLRHIQKYERLLANSAQT